jgi:predicted  nucleic acid-binding Zn-ribbon protein
MRRPVKLGDITDIRLEISSIRERELDFIDQVRKAEGELDRANEELEKAKQAFKQATQDLEKLLEHRVTWQDEQNLEAERLADLELEDFIGPKNDLNLHPDEASYELN